MRKSEREKEKEAEREDIRFPQRKREIREKTIFKKRWQRIAKQDWDSRSRRREKRYNAIRGREATRGRQRKRESAVSDSSRSVGRIHRRCSLRRSITSSSKQIRGTRSYDLSIFLSISQLFLAVSINLSISQFFSSLSLLLYSFPEYFCVSLFREQKKKQVFQPGWRQPTQTIEEAVEEELRNGGMASSG